MARSTVLRWLQAAWSRLLTSDIQAKSTHQDLRDTLDTL